MYGKQNRDFRPKGEGRSGRRPLLPKRKLNILVNLTLGKSYHSVVTFLHAQKIRCYTFSIQSSSQLISYYICPWKVGPKVFYFSLGNAEIESQNIFSQLVPSVQKLAVLATFLPYQNSPTLGLFGYPYFFQTKTGISVGSMITMFSIMSSIFKTWTMLNAVQANLLVSQKVIKGPKMGLF